MHIDELDTPAVVINLDVMERNMSRLAVYCRQHGLRLRPHTKTHKIPELARKQLENGATGITVAKVGEAEVMADFGIKDILVAYPIVTSEKARRLAAVAEKACITVSLDSEEAALALSRQAQERGVRINILVEVDVGLHRCGVRDEHAALDLANAILNCKGLDLAGVMYYPGQLLTKPSQQLAQMGPINDLLKRTLEAFDLACLPVKVVGGGSTPTTYNSHLFHGITEIRPGMYLFNDRNMVGAEVAALEDCALSVLVTVVSTAVSGRAIVDGGSKTFSSDRFLTGNGVGFGLVKEDSKTVFEWMSEEHGHLNIEASERKYRVGERLSIVPNHVCTTINMHREVYGARAGQVEEVWKVAAQGKIR